MSAVVWFRNDLRVADNPALYEACRQHQQLSAIYVDCPAQNRRHRQSGMQRDFISRNLACLAQALAQLGIPLQVLSCDDYDQVPELLSAWLSDKAVAALYANREIGVNEQGRDQSVQERLKIPVYLSNGDCVVDHGQIKTGAGEMYRVFTPFSRAWLQQVGQHGYHLLAVPDAVGTPCPVNPVALQGDLVCSEHWPAGEAQAYSRLESFCVDGLRLYQQQRDFPSLSATSGLSAYLAIGVLSPAQCLAAIEAELGYLPLSQGETGFSWLNEIIWREFYRHLMVAHPRLSMHRAFKPETERIEWSDDEERFTRWCEGMTGFPIIDAAMRCLNQTGWMHNRLRMIVASFLSKDLHIDWRRGEAYFISKLIDGEIAANNGGWQWAAGTGADAAPYFRIFNPTTQSKRFDLDGEFIRQWLPELRDVPAKFIHQPQGWLSQNNNATSYPEPIVDHAQSRQHALAMFQELKA